MRKSQPNAGIFECSVVCCDLVRPEGFEPPIFRFVAEHSIQLSYGRIFYYFDNGNYYTILQIKMQEVF